MTLWSGFSRVDASELLATMLMALVDRYLGVSVFDNRVRLD